MASAKSALVTGANKGIGREVARQLAAQGAIADIKATYEVNVLGPIRVTQALLPLLLAAPAACVASCPSAAVPK